MNILKSEISTIESNTSNVLSLISQLISCNRLNTVGHKCSIPEPVKLLNSRAKFGAKKCSIDICVTFNA